jgi:hypothetical protein
MPNALSLIEKRIEQFYEETEESVKVVVDGSDEHLDLILSLTKPLDSLSKKFEELNEFLFENLNAYTNKQIENFIMPKLMQLNKSCMTLIGAIRTSFLYRDVRVSFKNYTRQYDLLREIMHDIRTIRLAKDNEFDNILKELNDI